jgi:hypothetical protein
VENQSDHREDQQNVNQATGHVKDTQPEQPCHEQDHKQDRENTHNLTSEYRDYVSRPKLTWGAAGIRHGKELQAVFGGGAKRPT